MALREKATQEILKITCALQNIYKLAIFSAFEAFWTNANPPSGSTNKLKYLHVEGIALNSRDSH